MDRSLVRTDQETHGIDAQRSACSAGKDAMAAFALHHHPELSSVSGSARHGGHGARGRSPWRMRRTKARRQGATAPGLRATHERVAGRNTDPSAHTKARTVKTRARGRVAALVNGAPWNPQT